MKRIALLLFVLAGFSAHAQLRYGFKTGLNFARINGPSETSDAGAELESWKNVTGFHIGMTLGYKFTDNFGVRGEFMYSKRGAKYTFDGQSYRIFKHSTGEVLTRGTSRYLININNSYLDIPVIAYARWKDFEISGGAYAGILVASSGEGSLRYSGTNNLGERVYEQPDKNNTELDFNLNYNYRKDDPGEGTGPSDEAMVNVVLAGGSGSNAVVSETPKTLGAYYDYPEGAKRLYNSLDYGLVGGLTYYISNALYFGMRIQYGLADITRNEADLAKARVGSTGERVYRDDKDQNFVIQASVGFSF